MGPDGAVTVRPVLRIANWRKRLAKCEDNRLRPGEQVVATLVLQVRGAVTRSALLAGAGGAARAVAGRSTVVVSTADVRRAGGRPGRYRTDGLAGRLPIKPLLLVLTDHDRVLAFSWVPVALTLTYEAEFRAQQIASIEVHRGFFARSAVVRFNDGSELPFDLPRGHERKPFLSRFQGDRLVDPA